MIAYRYMAVAGTEDEKVRHGVVLARDKLDAFDKLKRHQLSNINLKRMEGFAALWSRFTADVR